MSLPMISIVFFIISILLTITTLFGNLLTIISVARFPRLQTITNKLLVNLAVSDCIVRLVMPFRGAFFFDPDLGTQNWACVISSVLIQLSCASSICNLMFISVDRYVYIIYPLRYSTIMTSRICVFIIIMTWTYGVLFSSSVFVLELLESNIERKWLHSCSIVAIKIRVFFYLFTISNDGNGHVDSIRSYWETSI